MDGERLGWRVGGDDGTGDGGWLRCRGCGGSLQYDDGDSSSSSVELDTYGLALFLGAVWSLERRC